MLIVVGEPIPTVKETNPPPGPLCALLCCCVVVRCSLFVVRCSLLWLWCAERVQAVLDKYIEALTAIYERHKEQAGYGGKRLVIS